MKICAISDTHGTYQNLKIDKCELLFICIDIVPLKMQKKYSTIHKLVYKEVYSAVIKQPVEHIYLVGGNHDFFLEKSPSEIKDMLVGANITILYNEGFEY
jgi:predicted phosphodiesterase